MYLESPTPRNLQHRRPPLLSQAWLETFWGLKSNRGLGLGSQEQPWLGLGSQEQPWPENFWGLKSHRGRIVNGVSAAAAASVRRARCGFSEEGGPQEADDSQESGSKLAGFESSQENSSNRITTWRSSDFCNIQSNQALGALFRENSSPKPAPKPE